MDYRLQQLHLPAAHDSDQNISAPEIKAVITTSEKLTPEMRQVICEAFHTKVYEEYSCVENAFFACDNEFGQLLVSPDCGLIEIVNEDFEGRT